MSEELISELELFSLFFFAESLLFVVSDVVELEVPISAAKP
jgi:hypothetical protein